MTGSVSKRHFDRLNKRRPSPDIPGDMIRYRCVGREYTDLALGELHFAEYGMLKPWDHAAGILIHAEAGGFSAYTEDQTPYRPGPTTRKHLLAAANLNEWQVLRELFI
jgi:fructose-1,6-bisphosphatase/inositol monophosphatase family enzyme